MKTPEKSLAHYLRRCSRPLAIAESNDLSNVVPVKFSIRDQVISVSWFLVALKQANSLLSEKTDKHSREIHSSRSSNVKYSPNSDKNNQKQPGSNNEPPRFAGKKCGDHMFRNFEATSCFLEPVAKSTQNRSRTVSDSKVHEKVLILLECPDNYVSELESHSGLRRSQFPHRGSKNNGFRSSHYGRLIPKKNLFHDIQNNDTVRFFVRDSTSGNSTHRGLPRWANNCFLSSAKAWFRLGLGNDEFAFRERLTFGMKTKHPCPKFDNDNATLAIVRNLKSKENLGGLIDAYNILNNVIVRRYLKRKVKKKFRDIFVITETTRLSPRSRNWLILQSSFDNVSTPDLNRSLQIRVRALRRMKFIRERNLETSSKISIRENEFEPPNRKRS
ncbi:uncharacterized protein LOC129754227 [Uranotaenia lowii]|uniref:uncharacterized protein LOC129754227 n=1 Tax=Uranotaenia lowii TaxID=190385 RepID=UPI00247ACF1C|nr:uncharacterized protein LOC129754227 [Uranotaenia lowii]XP_055606120.1 uncharacterized protein LOC129754227 [Uranotaenia lowii]XP_055606121.1 uncharacterized protein LOC129754227 [Uranotaenia lowii]XP_055606122.1 uncharacterized protein LOC129754227 [Uranotaenia lowii]XP_055606123.1 uncharacterized protein LOC129754227 [Uranotaenia lowii]